jgi:hypothetical protein
VARDLGTGAAGTLKKDAEVVNFHVQSRKRYIWNRDNPLEYADPSGFSALTIDSSQTGFEDVAHLEPDDGAADAANDSNNGNYATPGKAAIAAGKSYDRITQTSGKEYGGMIYCTSPGHCGYTLSPDSGKHRDTVDSYAGFVPGGSKSEGTWHIHPYDVNAWYNIPIGVTPDQ